jgi:vancomycin permeability regulator SanA
MGLAAQIALLILVVGSLLALCHWAVGRYYAEAIYPVSSAPARPVAIVFGAGLRRDGTPTTVLADRVRAAVDLYRRGLVEWILLSGSVGRGDEPAAMRDFALALGAPESALVLDHGGDRTVATCERARAAFGIESALLVTQRYHLPRALALCHAVGLQAEGAAADLHPYGLRSRVIWRIREIPATAVALWEALVLRSSRDSEPAIPAARESSRNGP